MAMNYLCEMEAMKRKRKNEVVFLLRRSAYFIDANCLFL